MNALSDKRVVLGVSGGIAAYKAVTIASKLVQLGARVDVVMTPAALRFIQPLTFSAITHHEVHDDPLALWHGDFSGHVTLAKDADIVVVAPATAATIARLALGLSDDLIGLVVLATAAPVLVAPAMEERMLAHPATQDHLNTLASRGVKIVGPELGRLASGAIGAGRMAEPDTIVDAVDQLLSTASQRLIGRTVVVTAGGTREAIDPVRYVGNRSSGRMGIAIASAAARQGANVVLISTVPTSDLPGNVKVVTVESAREMLRAVEEAVVDADVLIMAAAVADFSPEKTVERKIKKQSDTRYLDLRLVRTPDIIAVIDRPGLVKIGFAAETEQLVENARRKLREKGLDMIVANDAVSTIGAKDVAATLVTADGTITAMPRMSKTSLALEIVERVADILSGAESRDL
jgi:phosphopantothenoylcysteine decarboxylase / phosphopantothenate---cysteine ligase